MRARIDTRNNMCLIETDDVVIAEVYCHPDGDMVMNEDEADNQLSLLGLKPKVWQCMSGASCAELEVRKI
jgi:hypothetical protein